MKPLKLSMQAFGSYGKKTEIAFDKLQQNLFLISGDTGAGKSTIFDAIVFALYGKSGSMEKNSQKEGTDMQSQFAESSVTPFVELTFATEGGKKIYTVHRVPAYMKMLTRGENKGKQARKISGSVSLMMPDGKEYPAKEANRKIEEIIGLSRQQFMQVAMIAQGEFMELLRTDSDKKREIFRKLFDTELYQQIIEEMGKRRREKEKDIAQIRTGCQTEVAHMYLPEEYEGYEQLQQHRLWIEQGKLGEMEGFLESFEKLCLFMKEDVKKATREKQEKQEQRDKKRDSYSRAESLQQSFAAIEQAEEILRQCKEREEDICNMSKEMLQIRDAYEIQWAYDSYLEQEKQWKNSRDTWAMQKEQEPLWHAKEQKLVREEALAKERYDAQLKMHSRITERTQKAIEQFDQWELAVEKEKQLKKVYEEWTETETQMADSLKVVEKQQRACQEEEATLRQAPEQRERLLHEQEMVQRLFEEGEQLKELDKEIEQQDKTWQQYRQKYIDASEQYRQRNEQYQEQRKFFLDAQAGFLARELQDDIPCPVCGSRKHPHPASEQENALSREELDALSEEVENIRMRQEELASKTNVCGKLKEEKEKQKETLQTKWYLALQKQPIDWQENGTIDHIMEQVHQWMLKVCQKVEQNRQEIEELQQMEKKLSQLQGEIEKKRESLEVHRRETAAHKSQWESARVLQKQLKQTLPYATREQAREELVQAQKNCEERKQEQEKLRKQWEEVHEKWNTSKAIVQEYGEKLPEMELQQRQKKEIYVALLKEKNMTQVQWKKIVQQYDREKEMELQKIIEAHTNEKVAAKSAMETAQKAVGKEEKPDMEQVQKEWEEAEAQWKEAEETYQQRLKWLEANETVYERLHHKMKDRKKILEEHGRIDTLYRMLSGNESGNRMDLETFVQRYYMERILCAANQRFDKLSGGQFSLCMVEEEQAGMGKNRGLDLRIYSTVTGKEREVKTLSGGESFLAALSLALGMSDQIRQHSAAIELDMLFIDEGFGSLDQQSRNQAVRVLQEMAGKDKLVGIISHVTELKQEIDEQLLVEKQRDGSRVRWL